MQCRFADRMIGQTLIGHIVDGQATVHRLFLCQLRQTRNRPRTFGIATLFRTRHNLCRRTIIVRRFFEQIARSANHFGRCALRTGAHTARQTCCNRIGQSFRTIGIRRSRIGFGVFARRFTVGANDWHHWRRIRFRLRRLLFQPLFDEFLFRFGGFAIAR